MTTRLLSLFFLVTLLLMGCADGNAPSSGARSTENSFPPPSDEPFETPDNSTGQPNPGTNEVVVSVQATEGLLASWHRSLFKALTPASTYAFNGLERVRVRNLSVHQVTSSFGITSSSSVRLNYSTRENNDGTYSILFDDAVSIPARIDVVIRAQLENGTLLWAPLISNRKTIKVNIVSTYLIEQLFRAVQNQGMTLSGLTPCGREFGCENQHEARLLLWSGVTQNAQNFDILIPEQLSALEARTFLANISSFQTFVEAGIASVLDKGFIQAISAPLEFTDLLETKTTPFNSVFFSLGLGQREPEQPDGGSVLFNRTSTPATNRLADGSTEYIYPNLDETGIKTTITTRSVFGDLPYIRLSLGQPDSGSFITNENTTDEINSFASAPSNSYINTKGFLNLTETPYQTITGKGSDSVRGWLTNPLFTSLYGDIERSYLMSAPASTGRIYDLTELGNKDYQRNRIVENTSEFNYILHLEAGSEPVDIITATNGKTFGVVALEQKLDADSDTPLSFSVELSRWQINRGSIFSGPVDLSDTGFYQKLEISRNRQQIAQPLAISPPGVFDLQLESAASTVYDSGLKALVDKHLGRVQLLDSGTEYATGAANPQGQKMAFVSSTAKSQGLILATETEHSIGSLANVEYQIQGHTLGIHAESSELTTYNGSSISIDENSVATLHLQSASASQNTITMEATGLRKNRPTASPPTGMVIVEEGLLQIDFGNIDGQPFSVKGFISKNSETLQLLARHGNRIGLLLGMRNLSLPRS
ncbi:MAG: hypothetical protein CSA52_03290 [Gammaproteobacteria bacterium]|nr:MAG: hypothetical protein CSB48_04020 [Pseudomonadota bacterium]PIE38219.1 MAG: hypothetical protein CSA52_03290 [Gammaproteobacteria bacterium]